MRSVKEIKQPNPKITAKVAAIGGSGDGVVKDGIGIFIPFTAIGDLVNVPQAKQGTRIQPSATTLIEASPDRTTPPCPHHGNIGMPSPQTGCGGCRMQHLADDEYRHWKRSLVITALGYEKLNGDCVGDLHVSPPKSRRRAALAAERQGKTTIIGFMERGTHRIVDMHTCLILRPELFALVQPLRELPILRDKEKADYVLTVLDGAIDLVIERKRELDLPERETLSEFAQTFNLARISWRAGPRSDIEPVAHRRPLYVRFGPAIGGSVVNLPPAGFLQATAEGEAALVTAVMAALPESCRTLDLFAGSGTFSFPASTRGPVHAADSSSEAVSAIKFAARPGITASKRDLFTDPVTEFDKYDAVIFDPPYTGAKAQAGFLARSKMPLVIAVSCNPVSFARDAAILCAGGYDLECVTPVDQFLWSAELEVVGVFRR